jgi:hypothetical protein
VTPVLTVLKECLVFKVRPVLTVLLVHREIKVIREPLGLQDHKAILVPLVSLVPLVQLVRLEQQDRPVHPVHLLSSLRGFMKCCPVAMQHHLPSLRIQIRRRSCLRVTEYFNS